MCLIYSGLITTNGIYTIIVKKLVVLGLDQNIIDWVVSFLSDRQQCTKGGHKTSATRIINRSIVQGSGVGPSLFIVLVIDLRPQGSTNHMTKYADDTSLLVPEINTVSLQEEFDHLQVWAQTNKLIINMLETKEIVFHRSNHRGLVMPSPLANINRVKFAKLLGVYIMDNLGVGKEIDYLLKNATSGYTFLIR